MFFVIGVAFFPTSVKKKSSDSVDDNDDEVLIMMVIMVAACCRRRKNMFPLVPACFLKCVYIICMLFVSSWKVIYPGP